MNTNRVLISMPDRFLSDVDKIAKEENRSRSELIREALRTYMHKQKIVNRFMKNEEDAKELMGLLK